MVERRKMEGSESRKHFNSFKVVETNGILNSKASAFGFKDWGTGHCNFDQNDAA